MKKINEYMRIKDAAQFLGVTENTLRNWEKEKKITVYRNPQNRYRLYRQRRFRTTARHNTKIIKENRYHESYHTRSCFT